MTDPQRILVIKLSALGDFVQAFPAFAAIRAHHPHAHITLLTTRPFVALAEASPWFDAVLTDSRPRFWQIGKVLILRAHLRAGRFQRVYDLQTSDRSSGYLRLLGGPSAVEWSGIARGCSHPHANPHRNSLHTLERQADQLQMAGVPALPSGPDLSWLDRADLPVPLPEKAVLLVPGGAPHRPDKRWPADHYAAVATALQARGMTPVILGTASEQAEADAIMAACPQAVSLLGKTGLTDLAVLARRSVAAIGNDTGPMHLLATCGCPSVVVYSHASDPALCAQRGPAVTILRRPSLSTLTVPEVMEAFTALPLRPEPPVT